MSRLFYNLNKYRIKFAASAIKPTNRLTNILNRNYAVYHLQLNNKQLLTQCVGSKIPNYQYKCYSSAIPFEFPPMKFPSPKILAELKNPCVSIRYTSLYDLLAVLQKINPTTLTEDNCIGYLIKCSRLVNFKNDEKEKLINTIWSKMLEKDHAPSAGCIIALLKAYCHIGKTIENPKEFFDKYICDGDVSIYEEFLHLACVNGTQVLVDSILEAFKEDGWPNTERVYNLLIVYHSRAGSLDKCEDIVKTMREKITPGAETYKELVNAYVQNNNKTNALNLLNAHGKELDNSQLFDIIRCAALHGSDSEIITAALEFLESATLNSKQIVLELENICIETLYLNKDSNHLDFDPYDIIVKHLPVPVFENEDMDKYGLFGIREMISKGMNKTILIEYCGKLVSSKRNERALHVACAIALKHHSPLAVDLLTALSEKEQLRPHYFWPLFHQATNESDVLEITKFANKLNTNLDIETMLKYIFPKISNTLNDSALGFKILEACGLKSSRIKTAMLIYLLEQNKPVEAFHVAESYPARVNAQLLTAPIVSCILGISNKKHIFQATKLIKEVAAVRSIKNIDWAGQILCAIAGSYKEAQQNFPTVLELIRNFTRIGVKVSKTESVALLARMTKQRNVHAECERLLSHIVEEKWISMSQEEMLPGHNSHNAPIDELENHLHELQAKNLNTRGTLRRLFLTCVREHNFKRALEVRELCDRENVIDSPAMLAATVELMTQVKNVDQALGTLNDLQRHFPNFVIDDYKILDLATLLVEQHKMEEAKNLLTDHAKIAKPKPGKHIIKNVRDLLTTAANIAVKNNTAENVSNSLLHFLVDSGYCSYNNITLGPATKEYIDKRDISNAVNTFLKSTQEYKKTPQQVFMMSLLIAIANNEELQQIYNVNATQANNYLKDIVEAAKEIHPAAAINTNLIVAVSESGTEQQLRKLLMNPSVTFDAEILTKTLAFHSSAGKATTIVNLARCCRGLRHQSIKEQDLYDLLLGDFIRQNDFDAALKFFDQILIDKEVKLSKKFIMNLTALLEKNNLEIPSSIKLLTRN